jgi:hypothetical protein
MERSLARMRYARLGVPVTLSVVVSAATLARYRAIAAARGWSATEAVDAALSTWAVAQEGALERSRRLALAAELDALASGTLSVEAILKARDLQGFCKSA